MRKVETLWGVSCVGDLREQTLYVPFFINVVLVTPSPEGLQVHSGGRSRPSYTW